jgi:hypothetical protein
MMSALFAVYLQPDPHQCRRMKNWFWSKFGDAGVVRVAAGACRVSGIMSGM